MKRTLVILLSALAFTDASATDFKPGQRWTCMTDQGADAFLTVLGVDGDAVSFSWGLIDPDTDNLTSLCNKRDALSIIELVEFCRLIGDEASEGHDRLRTSCANK